MRLILHQNVVKSAYLNCIKLSIFGFQMPFGKMWKQSKMLSNLYIFVNNQILSMRLCINYCCKGLLSITGAWSFWSVSIFLLLCLVPLSYTYFSYDSNFKWINLDPHCLQIKKCYSMSIVKVNCLKCVPLARILSFKSTVLTMMCL